MLPSTSPSKALLACLPSTPWNLSSFMEFTLSSPCSRSDLLSLLLTLKFSLLKPAPFCKLFASLGSTNKSATSHLFFSYLTLVLSSPPCPLLHLSFYLKLFGRSGRNCHLSFPVLSDYNGTPDTSFSWKTTWLMSWPRQGVLLSPLQSLVVSLLLSLVFTLLLSRIGGVFVSSEFFDTQVPSIFTKELVLPHYGRCALSRLRCNGHSLLLSSYLFRIGRIENPSCSTCRLCLSTTSGPGHEELLGFWGSMVICHAPVPQKRWGNNNLLFYSCLHFNHIPNFSWGHLDCIFSFFKHVFLLKAKFFFSFQGLTLSLLLHGALLRSPSFFCIKLFFDLSSLMLPWFVSFFKYQYYRIGTLSLSS